MGIISLEKSNRLIWLGRYTERTFTICRTLSRYYDDMLDHDEFAYRGFLDCLGLPYIYGSREAFIRTYIFDPNDPNSLVSQLSRALDNAIVMREELTSDTLCYIQMALDTLRAGADDSAPMLTLQQVVDDLFAFWGSADDNVANEECRTLMKCGKYVERLDLYVRLGYRYREVEKETSKLMNRLSKVRFAHNERDAQRLLELTRDEETYKQNKQAVLALLCTVLS
ncbi:MAG: alpha-E domain-containing protein [Clostridia bacterium]|nr:alpha-E domain-containing protein [Clostridia bacterium]